MHRSEFEKFATAVRPRLTARAAGLIGDSEAAQDVVQDCLIKLWDIRDTLEEYSSPEALALTIVHRLSLNLMRHRTGSVELCDDLIGSAEPSPEDRAIDEEGRLTAERLMAMLPDTQQAIIRMRHVDGLSNSEIAAIIGSTDGAVRTALSRARLRIAEIYSRLQHNNAY